jgi:hypothetical protein
MVFCGEVSGDRAAGIEEKGHPAARTERALQAPQDLRMPLGGDEIQRAVHQHHIEPPFDIEIEQILLDGLDRQRPLAGEFAAKLQRRSADVEHGDVQAKACSGAGDQREQACVLGAGDQDVGSPAGEKTPKLGFQLRILLLRAGGCSRQAQVGPERMLIAAIAAQPRRQRVGLGCDARQIFDSGSIARHDGQRKLARHRPVRASEFTQPTMRDLALSMSFLEKKSSGFTLSIG